MQLRIVDTKGFVTENTPFDSNDLNAVAEQKLEVRQGELCAVKDGAVLAKLAPNPIAVTFVDGRAMLSYAATRRVFAEVDNPDKTAVTAMVEAHNRRTRSRNPLGVEFETRVQDSLLTIKYGQVANFRGFMNLMIIFTVINYSGQLYTHVRQQGVNVEYFARMFDHMFDINAYVFAILGLLYLSGVYALQLQAFRRNLNETGVTVAIIVSSLIYTILIQNLVVKLRIPISRLTSPYRLP